MDAALLCAFAAADPRVRAGFFVVGGCGCVGGAGPVDGGTQLVLCGKDPFCEAADFLGLEAFACDGSACLEEERGFHFVCGERRGWYMRGEVRGKWT